MDFYQLLFLRKSFHAPLFLDVKKKEIKKKKVNIQSNGESVYVIAGSNYTDFASDNDT